MKLVAAFALALLTAPALAQPVQQGGQITSGHVASWATNGVIQDAGTATAGRVNSLGLYGNGNTPFCITSSPTAPPFAGSFWQHCLGVSSTAGGYANLNGPTNLPWAVNINGTSVLSLTVAGGLVTDVSNATAKATGSTTARTLASRFSDRWDLRDFGAKFDGTTDDTAAIQAGVTAACASTNSTMLLAPVGTAKITSTIAVPCSNLGLVGQGFAVPDNNTAATRIKWYGAANGTMLSVVPPSGGNRIAGLIYDGILLDGNSGLAGTAADFRDVWYSNLRIAFINTAQYGVRFDIQSTPTVEAVKNNQGNTIEVYGDNYNSTAPCLYMGGPPDANTSINYIPKVYCAIKNGDGVVLGNTDNNQFGIVDVFRVAGGTGRAIVFKASNSPEAFSRANQIQYAVTAGAPIVSEGTETATYPAILNTVWTLDYGNGTPEPTVGTNSSVAWGYNDGRPPCGVNNRTDSPLGSGSLACGVNNTITAAPGFAIGNTNTVSANNAVALGLVNTAAGAGSLVAGAYAGDNGAVGQFWFNSSPFGSVGDNGLGIGNVHGTSAAGASVTPTADQSAVVNSTNSFPLSAASALAMECVGVARRASDGASAMWTVAKLLAKRPSNAASTALVGTPTITLAQNDAAASAWTLTVAADTTNGAVKFTATGDAGSATVRVVVRCDMTMVK